MAASSHSRRRETGAVIAVADQKTRVTNGSHALNGMRRPAMPNALKTVVFCLTTAVAACAVQSPEDRAIRPFALLDAYAIAHGMAASYAQSPDANVSVVMELRRLDRRAATAALAMVHAPPGAGTEDATEAAVLALTAFAAAHIDVEP